MGYRPIYGQDTRGCYRSPIPNYGFNIQSTELPCDNRLVGILPGAKSLVWVISPGGVMMMVA